MLLPRKPRDPENRTERAIRERVITELRVITERDNFLIMEREQLRRLADLVLLFYLIAYVFTTILIATTVLPART